MRWATETYFRSLRLGVCACVCVRVPVVLLCTWSFFCFCLPQQFCVFMLEARKDCPPLPQNILIFVPLQNSRNEPQLQVCQCSAILCVYLSVCLFLPFFISLCMLYHARTSYIPDIWYIFATFVLLLTSPANNPIVFSVFRFVNMLFRSNLNVDCPADSVVVLCFSFCLFVVLAQVFLSQSRCQSCCVVFFFRSKFFCFTVPLTARVYIIIYLFLLADFYWQCPRVFFCVVYFFVQVAKAIGFMARTSISSSSEFVENEISQALEVS